ncbi:hypothetical protein AD998_01690 [bacterium 336/3]|nr:hypothetical protein AD998_01690 [bacterium 336/3]
MKQIKYNNQDQPFVNSDFELQNEEIYKAIENQHKGRQAFVFSGCIVSGLDISEGLCFINGKIVELAAATVAAFPRYIKLTQVDYNPRLHPQSGSNLDTKTNYKAEIVEDNDGLTDYITITSSGCNRRIQNHFISENGHRLNWSYVECHKDFGSGNQNISANSSSRVIFTSEVDDLGEYDASTGIFTANQSGTYTFHWGGRVDLGGDGFSFLIEFLDNATWRVLAQSLRNVVSMQGNITTGFSRRLNAGQQVKFSVVSFAANISVQEAHLSIIRTT